MLASEAIPSVVFLLLLMFVPDTPRWLVLRGRNEEALAQLQRVTNEVDARSILADIQRTLVVRTGKLFSFGAAVVVVGILISVFQQFVGINAVMYYAPLMFQKWERRRTRPLLQTVVVGVANLVFTIVAIVTVDRWEEASARCRRVGHGGSDDCAGMSVQRPGSGAGRPDRSGGVHRRLRLLMGTGCWVLLAEMFPNSIKGKGMGLAVAAQCCEPVGVSLVQGARWQFDAQRPVQSRLRILALWWHERARRAVRDPICAGDQGAQSGGYSGVMGQG